MSKQTKSTERKHQLITMPNYDIKKMIFDPPRAESVAGTAIQYRRINISTLNPDGSIGDLLLPTERVFSFGVSENLSLETKQVNGHVLPLCLWNKNGATPEEKAWTDTFDKIVENCKRHLIDNREEIGQYDLSMELLKKLNPLYWKREKGKIVEGTGPTLYAKLIASKKHNKILSMFFTPDGDTIEPLSLLKKYCYVNAVVKVESIFVGNKISLQLKLYQAFVEPIETGMKPFLDSRPKPSAKVASGGTSLNDVEEEGSVENSDEEEKPLVQVAQAPAAAPKKVVKKVVPKK